MLNQLITSKTRLRLLIKFFISQANRGYLNGLASEFNESTNSIRKELNHLSEAGYLEKYKDDNKVGYKAIRSLKKEAIITCDKKDIQEASLIILPGVGSFQQGMKNLKDRNLIELLHEEVIHNKKPFLGICLELNKEHGIKSKKNRKR